ncbi:ABC transporter substrate-binding protein [Chelativorans sp. AA-79]|uniref:ABC transporter substrate-binding protein n=1 Tax=Chelativorans sp. AA-79 TaxID=3028735 RepID=UPI0023FA1686|nr:ABC transporter substrate-binding protein [Chelativorans sp. AA-79]WEX08411.1 ABC transporter substrate-binding protein [Chelativorans sp. AA-79]
MKSIKVFLTATTFLAAATAAKAVDLEVTHWWTSGGEAAAVAEFAKAFDATGNKWVDGAIAGGGNTARPIMISRITGGDPMGATQFNHGQQAAELVEAGFMRDLTDLAEQEGWRDVVEPSSLLDSCTLDGRIYCVPVNIHSWEWLWLSNKAFEDAGVPVPANWDEFVAAAPALEKAGKIPLAVGSQSWQIHGVFRVLLISLAGPEIYQKVYGDKDAEVAAGPEVARIFKAADDARKMAAKSNVQDWNQATNLVITDQAGGQIIGDWAQGDFQVAGEVAGEDYTCLPGLGVGKALETGGDAFYFPLVDDPEVSKAQEELARVMLDPEVQVAFNLKKGSVPVRGDIDQSAANDCMKKGLAILEGGGAVPSQEQLMSPDVINQINDLMAEFFSTPSMTPEDAQQRFADIIGSAA